MTTSTPCYLHLWRTGELQRRVETVYARLATCDMCPRRCGVDRLDGELGECHTGELARVSSYGPHHGEENVLRGWRGSGTIFFTRCNLHCQFCQNYDISQTDDGVVDIYMPDIKYAGADAGLRYSQAPDYPQINQAAVREMHRQVGDLQVDAQGLAVRGLLVRHLVLPNQVAGSREIMRFLAEEISPNTYLNVMGQYRPAWRASRFSELNRPISRSEYQAAVQAALDAGLQRLDRR